MRSRYYNPEIKRFINQDILTGNIGNNKSLNRYSYVEGNPVSYTDPFGLSPYKAMGHAVLDVIGIFCPIADVINATWYFLDGEAGEGIKSLVYAIPGTDIYGTLTKFTTKGSKGYKIAATAEDIIIHGGYAGTIVFVANDTGQLSADLIDKYFVDGAEVTSETAIEIITLALTGTQLGLSTKNGISFNGKMYADDVTDLDMSGVKISDDVNISNGTDVVKGGWNNNVYLTIYEVKDGTGTQGVGNPVKVEGRGNTGRTTPNTLNEQMAMHQVMSNPLDGAIDMSQLNKRPIIMTDPRWPASEGWVKMSNNVNGIEIHFVYNKITGAFDDFKFK